VASWRVSGGRHRNRINDASTRWIQAIIERFPEIKDGVYAEEASAPLHDFGVHVRRRDISPEVASVLKSDLGIRLREFLEIRPKLPNAVSERFIAQSPGWKHPAGSVIDLRMKLHLGLAPISDVTDAIEMLGVPVVKVSSTEKWASLVDVARDGHDTVFAIVHSDFGQDLSGLRHALFTELGYLLIGKATRARAKLAAATHFSDEMLVPLKALEAWLPLGRIVYEAEALILAIKFNTPVASIRRQIERFGRRIRVGGATEYSPTYLRFLAQNVRGHAFQ
jgi:hypothetical protein